MSVVQVTLRPEAPASVAATRIRLRAERRIRWLRHLWSAMARDGERWVGLSHGEVDHILVPPGDVLAAERSFYATDEVSADLSHDIEDADAAFREDPRWQRLRSAFDVGDADADLLSLALAAESEPLLHRLYAYLHDDARAGYPTPWLASVLFDWPGDAAVDRDNALMRWALAHPVEPDADTASATTGWRGEPEVARWVGGRDDPGLPGSWQLIRPEETLGLPVLYERELAEIVSAAHAVEGGGARVEVRLVAPDGAGKRTLAAQAAAMLGLDLLAVDARALDEVGANRERTRAVRTARLAGAALYWTGAGSPAMLAVPLAFVSTEDEPASAAHDGVVRLSLSLPRIDRAARLALWGLHADASPPAPVAEWALSPAEVRRAGLVAAAGEDAVVSACKHSASVGSVDLFGHVPLTFTWTDIVLPDDVRRELEEFEDQARLRSQVYDEWGFGRLLPLGRGVSAMFAGPSGTGKTMAAQVIARSLGMDLLRVDLSGVVNKYIGETEKRLKRVFDACERVNVVLFFDEADALFGQRTQVKDAHDRFANIEIDYLLQRMEEFDGIAILATNRRSDMDRAFVRRLRFVVDFVRPGPPERLRLWRLALPERAPGGDTLLAEIDWRFLADELEMTGADIKAAGLGAAFLARAAGTTISMEHVLHAAKREMRKHDRELTLSWEAAG